MQRTAIKDSEHDRVEDPLVGSVERTVDEDVVLGLSRSLLNTRYAVDRTFEDTVREVNHLLDQMTEDERRTYLVESLYLLSLIHI